MGKICWYHYFEYCNHDGTCYNKQTLLVHSRLAVEFKSINLKILKLNTLNMEVCTKSITKIIYILVVNVSKMLFYNTKHPYCIIQQTFSINCIVQLLLWYKGYIVLPRFTQILTVQLDLYTIATNTNITLQCVSPPAPQLAVCNDSWCILKLMVVCRTLSAETDDNERPKDTWGPGGR